MMAVDGQVRIESAWDAQPTSGPNPAKRGAYSMRMFPICAGYFRQRQLEVLHDVT